MIGGNSLFLQFVRIFKINDKEGIILWRLEEATIVFEHGELRGADQIIQVCFFKSRWKTRLQHGGTSLHVIIGIMTPLIGSIVINVAENSYTFQNENFYSLSQFVALITSVIQTRSRKGSLTGSQV